ncbi:MAG: hypothetical protein PHS59_15675 [Paludibacter sp.]|nr:hypothetical protein [Paludibacter sp.]
MKKSIIYLFGILFVLSLTACQDEDKINNPKASIEVSKQVLNINESVQFTFNGLGQQVSIFTGDKNHIFDSINRGSSGLVFNKGGVFNYAYRTPGKYKVVIIASNYTDNATTLLNDTCSVYINVVDSDASISSIICPQILFDQVAATNFGNDWLVRLPQKVLYKGTTATISSKEKLAITMSSDSAKFIVNNSKYVSTLAYELINPVSINVKPYTGDTVKYKLYMLYYPEFSTFNIMNIAATLTRNTYSYNQMQLNVKLPVGTDFSSLVPQFTLSQGQHVYINGIEQISSVSQVNFSAPIVYQLQNSVLDRPDLVAITNVTVIVGN